MKPQSTNNNNKTDPGEIKDRFPKTNMKKEKKIKSKQQNKPNVNKIGSWVCGDDLTIVQMK